MRTSPSSSSTSSTSIVARLSNSGMGPGLLVCGELWVLREHRQRETERSALFSAGVQPDPAPEILDDLPAHGQPYTGARIGGPVVQPLEDHEDPVRVFGADPYAVVGYGKRPGFPVACHGYGDPRRPLAPELDRVAYQVLEDRGEERELRRDYRQRAGLDDRAGALDLRLEVRPCRLERRLARDRCGFPRDAADPAEREQVVDEDLHALGAVHGEVDVLIGLLVELAAVAAL